MPRVILASTLALPRELAPVAQWFHALSDVTRLLILGMLVDHEQCVRELQRSLDVEQSLLSFHLKVLRDAGLVRPHRDGRWIYYAIDTAVVDRVVAFTQSVKPLRRGQQL